MNIERLPKPTPDSTFVPLCHHVTKPAPWRNLSSAICSNVARFKLDGVKLCKQHAGIAALNYLLSEQEK